MCEIGPETRQHFISECLKSKHFISECLKSKHFMSECLKLKQLRDKFNIKTKKLFIINPDVLTNMDRDTYTQLMLDCAHPAVTGNLIIRNAFISDFELFTRELLQSLQRNRVVILKAFESSKVRETTSDDRPILTHYQTIYFRLFQTERVCRRQFQI